MKKRFFISNIYLIEDFQKQDLYELRKHQKNFLISEIVLLNFLLYIFIYFFLLLDVNLYHFSL